MVHRLGTSTLDAVEAAITLLGISGIVVLVFVLATSPFGEARVNTIDLRIASNTRSFYVALHHCAIVNSSDQQFEIPPTWALVFPYLVEQKDGAEHFAGPNVGDFGMGELSAADMMTGRISETRIIEVAERLGVPGQSWEWVMGYWLSRDVRDYESKHPEIIIGGTHQTMHSIALSAVILADGAVLYGDDGRIGMRRIRKIIEADRRARECLNLAPLPEEFRTWLLTGEPASMGDGTFVPPKLEEYGLR